MLKESKCEEDPNIVFILDSEITRDGISYYTKGEVLESERTTIDGLLRLEEDRASYSYNNSVISSTKIRK